MVTIYTSTTCAPCKVAKRQLAAADITVNEVQLDTDPQALFDLKMRTGREVVQTPLFEYPAGEFHDMTGLRNLIETARG